MPVRIIIKQRGWRGARFACVGRGLFVRGTGRRIPHACPPPLLGRSGSNRAASAIPGIEPLGFFSGDFGKALLPKLTAAMIALWPWRGAVAALGVPVMLTAAVLAVPAVIPLIIPLKAPLARRGIG